jgi:hypothetical protein
MRSILSISILLACAQAGFGQPNPDTLWTRTYGGALDECAYSVQQTTDGGYIVAGVTCSFGAGGMDFYLVRTNSSGDTLWTRTYGGSNNDEAYSVQQTTDGGYIAAGFTCSFGAGGCDFYLVKTDGQGDTLWTHAYGGIYGANSYDLALCAQQTGDGGYIVAGFTDSTSADSELPDDFSPDFYLVKTNSQGEPLWTRTYGGSCLDDAWSVQQTADGGYIVAGRTSSFGAGFRDFYLVKTDSQGDTLWTRTYGGSDWEIAFSVQQTADAGYIVAGRTSSFGAGNSDFYVVKTNGQGDTVWTRTYGGSSVDGAYSVQQTSDGGYIVAGYTSSFGVGGWDFYLVKTGPEYANVGYVTLISPGPPDWGYRLHWVSGALSQLVFTNFCSGTVGSVSGAAATAGWAATNCSDSIVFAGDTWLSSGSIDTFWLSHPTCSDYVIWTAGDSSGMIEGPLPVELTTFEAFAGDGQVTVRWRTESELDNDHFLLHKRKAADGDFHKLAEIPGHGTATEPHDYEYVDRFVQNGIAYEYQISDVDITGRETIHEQIVSATPSAAAVPTEFALHAPYPNPFNPITSIRYDVKETGLVSVKVFDLLGREVATLVHATVPAGSHSIEWNAGDLPSGVYLCRMEAQDFMQTRKVVLLK